MARLPADSLALFGRASPPVAPADFGDIAAEATEHGPGLFGHFMAQDARLVARGFHPVSPWWRTTLRRWVDSGKPWLLALVGRGGGKSSVLERVALAQAIHAPRAQPPGERWLFPFISRSTDDARRRIVELQRMVLDAYGVDVDITGRTPTLALTDAHGNPVDMVSVAATIANVSGPSSIGCMVDEAAKMHDGGANPFGELVTSLAETSRARDGWRGVRCSSAWWSNKSHHVAIRRGDNTANFVARIGPEYIEAARQGFDDVARWEEAHGDSDAAERICEWARTLTAASPNVPTWIANPTIGAIKSRELLETLSPGDLEGLPRAAFWLRESGSRPLDPPGAARAFEAVQVQLAPAAPALIATGIGIAPGADGQAWGAVVVGLGAAGDVVALQDVSALRPLVFARIARALPGLPGQPVLCCSAQHAARVEGARVAYVATDPEGWRLPGVAPQAIHDGPVLRTDILESLYAAGRMRHAPAMGTLEADLRAHNATARAPRVEALVAAVSRLVACHPFAGARLPDPSPVRRAATDFAVIVGGRTYPLASHVNPDPWKPL